MDQQEIASNIGRARNYLASLPAMAQFRDIPACATVEHDLVIRVSSPEGLPDGMLAGIGNTAAVPSPGWYFRAALASQIAMFITMRCAEASATLEDLEVIVDAESDDRGALGMDENIPAGPLSMTVTVRYSSSNLDDAATREIVEWGVHHAPVYDAVTRAVPIGVEIERSAPTGDHTAVPG